MTDSHTFDYLHPGAMGSVGIQPARWDEIPPDATDRYYEGPCPIVPIRLRGPAGVIVATHALLDTGNIGTTVIDTEIGLELGIDPEDCVSRFTSAPHIDDPEAPLPPSGEYLPGIEAAIVGGSTTWQVRLGAVFTAARTTVPVTLGQADFFRAFDVRFHWPRFTIQAADPADPRTYHPPGGP